MNLLIRNARVLTMGKGPRPRRGPAMGQLGVIPQTDVILAGERIVAVGSSLSMPPGVRVIEAGGRILMPGFVDCHTHAMWAGDRLDEWDLRRAGASYLQLLQAGGGIHATVRAVREAGEEALSDLLAARLRVMLREGTTTVEVKSGYGLSTEHELKMLRAIRAAGAEWPGTVIPTALLGHALDPSDPRFVERTINETLPAVNSEFPGITVDAYCEQGAWSLRDCVRLLEAARALGHPVRVHADQFNSMGMVREALRLGALSVDHIESSTAADLEYVASSPCVAVLLPACGFHADGSFADARALVGAGGAVAVATNCNPGSAPTSSMPLALALAVRRCGLSPAEAIVAGTVNPASVLGLSDRGTIAPGQRADLILLRHRNERELTFEFGGNPVDLVICAGRVASVSDETSRLRAGV